MSCPSSSPRRKAGSAGCATRADAGRAPRARSAPDSRTAAQAAQGGRRRLEEEHQVHLKANAAYEDYRRNGRMRTGRRLGAHSPPKLLAVATPVLDLKIGQSGPEALPNDTVGKQGLIALERDFPAGATTPVKVVVDGSSGDPQVRRAVNDLRSDSAGIRRSPPEPPPFNTAINRLLAVSGADQVLETTTNPATLD